MKNKNDIEKRKALAKFRAQGSDPSIYEKAFDNSYIVHGHTNKYFLVLDAEERKELFKMKIEKLDELLMLGRYDEIPDELINSVLSRGSSYPLWEHGKDDHINGFYIMSHGVDFDYDWKEQQKAYRKEQQKAHRKEL